jgi:hypothetical protein
MSAARAGLGFILATALGACSPDAFSGRKTAPPGCGAGADGVVVTDAWVRAVAADRPMSAAYVTLCNADAADDRLVSVSSPAVATVEIHESTRTPQGVVGMRPVKAVALPTGRPVLLEPGGMHLMLIGPLGPLEAGGVVPLTLEFASGKTLTVDAEIRDGAANAPEHEH